MVPNEQWDTERNPEPQLEHRAGWNPTDAVAKAFGLPEKLGKNMKTTEILWRTCGSLKFWEGSKQH